VNQKALLICNQALAHQTQYAEQTGAASAGPAALIHLGIDHSAQTTRQPRRLTDKKMLNLRSSINGRHRRRLEMGVVEGVH
jgi:hypothetical protein